MRGGGGGEVGREGVSERGEGGEKGKKKCDEITTSTLHL